MEYVEQWMNGINDTPEELNEANLFLLSKEDTNRPPLDRIRPLCAYSPIRKCLETALDRLDQYLQWLMISTD